MVLDLHGSCDTVAARSILYREVGGIVTWVRRTEPPPPGDRHGPRNCSWPCGEFVGAVENSLLDANPDALWRCDNCGRLWILSEYGPYGAEWKRASWWLRWKYRNDGWNITPPSVSGSLYPPPTPESSEESGGAT